MSQLIDTLKRIRNFKPFQLAENHRTRLKKSRLGQKKYKLTVILLSAFVGIGFLYINMPLFLDRSDKIGLFQEQKSRVVQKQPAPVTSHADRTKQAASIEPVHPAQYNQTEQEMIKLNNQGVLLERKQDYWNGIYYLEQAKKMQPDQVEPLLNQAVAFCEMGLYGTALNLLEQAHHLTPHHPFLRRNLAILAQADIFDGPLIELFKIEADDGKKTD